MFTVTRFERFLAALAFAGACFYVVACAHLAQLLATLEAGI